MFLKLDFVKASFSYTKEEVLMLKLKWIFLTLIMFSCKKQNTKKTVSRPVNPEEIKNEVKSDEEIYIGKEFYSGDEKNYTVVKTDEISKNDSLTYSIYKNNNSNEYIFSSEKFISNEDQELFKIIDSSENEKVVVLQMPSLQKLADESAILKAEAFGNENAEIRFVAGDILILSARKKITYLNLLPKTFEVISGEILSLEKWRILNKKQIVVSNENNSIQAKQIKFSDLFNEGSNIRFTPLD